MRITLLLATILAITGLPPAIASGANLAYEWTLSRDRQLQSSSMTVVLDQSAPGAPALLATATGGEWNGYFTTKSGTLKGNHEYVVQLDYEIVTPTKPGLTFYMFARSEKLGYGADIWTTWCGASGTKGVAVLPMTLRDSDDWQVTLGIHQTGAIRLTGFRIYDGNGMTYRLPASVSAPTANRLAAPASFARPTGAGPIVIAPPNPARTFVLSATDFGLKADSPGAPVSADIATANGDAFKAAIEAARAQGASLLRIPKGVYRFASPHSLQIDKLSDIVVDGEGSEFLFTRHNTNAGAAVRISACHRFVLKNLFFDWDWTVRPIATITHVDSISNDGKTFVLSFPDIDAAATELLKSTPWQSIISIERLHPTGVDAGPSVNDKQPSTFETLGPSTLRVTFDTPLKLRAGGTYWIRHCYYEMPAIDVSEGSNILLEGIVIYSMPGMGWIMHGDLDHWTVRNCRLEIPEGSKRPMSTAADGLHVSGSRGYFLMDNCQIGNCGDDCVNIHDNCAQGVDRIDDHTIKVHSVGWRMSLAAGNAIELFRGDYSPLGYKSQIVEISHQGADATIKFADSLPVDVPADAIVWNHSRQTSNVHITGCVFHDNIGRGILLSAADATVDHCVFDHTASRGFQFHTELEPPHWWEGHGASNILFTNNRIVDTNLIGRDGGAPIFAKPNLPGGPTSVPIFHDILIADNEIVDSLGPSLELESCKNLIVEANRIRNKRNFARFSPQSSAITIRRSSNIVVFDNTWSGPYCTRPGVEYDPATTAGIVEHGNEIVR